MMDQRIVQWIEGKFQGLADELSERARRRWAAVEAVALGRGGVSVVSAATGLAHTTIRRGIRELGSGTHHRADVSGARVRAERKRKLLVLDCKRRWNVWWNRKVEAIPCRRCAGPA